MSESEKPPMVANLQYGGEYREELERAQRTGECPFCRKDVRNGWLIGSGDWFAKRNPYPTRDREGQNPAHQFLFIKIGHRDQAEPFSAADYYAIEVLRLYVNQRFNIKGGCLFIRMGDPLWSGCTVRHTHAHYYVPRLVADGKGGSRAVPIDIPAG